MDFIEIIGVSSFCEILSFFSAIELPCFLRLNKHWNQVLKNNEQFQKLFRRLGVLSVANMKNVKIEDLIFHLEDESKHLHLNEDNIGDYKKHGASIGNNNNFGLGYYRFLTVEKTLDLFSNDFPQLKSHPKCPYVRLEGYIQLCFGNKKAINYFQERMKSFCDVGMLINLETGTYEDLTIEKFINLCTDCVVGREPFQRGKLLLTKDSQSEYICDIFDIIQNSIKFKEKDSLFYVDCPYNVFRVNDMENSKVEFNVDGIRLWLRDAPREDFKMRHAHLRHLYECDECDHEPIFNLKNQK